MREREKMGKRGRCNLVTNKNYIKANETKAVLFHNIICDESPITSSHRPITKDW